MKLVYVFDAYCGWSYGFGPTMTEIIRRRPDLPVDVVSGGLFTGRRRMPIRDLGAVQEANAQVSEVTGVRFGAGYARTVADGSFVMDSEAAARGVAALRWAAPDRIAELAIAAQQAFYGYGLSLSAPATYRAIAEAAGLPPDGVVRAFASPEAAVAARADFARAAGLLVHRFPTLLVVGDERTKVLAVGHATADQIERRLDTLTAVL